MMMNDPSRYKLINTVQRRDAKLVLDNYAKSIQWRTDGRDALIDIGTASGDVFMDYLYPRLPPNFEEVVGSDISAKMVNHANQCYSDGKRIKFEVLDIGCEKIPKQLAGRFDHLTSFYCLQWVQNQLTMLKNIYQLLRSDGGDFLITFPSTQMFVYDVYKSLGERPKWSKYVAIKKHVCSPYHQSADAASEFGQLLQQAGFVDYNVDIIDEVYTYASSSSLREYARGVCPYLNYIPLELHEEFLDDLIDDAQTLNLNESQDKPEAITFAYKLLVAYARKPAGILKSVLSNSNEEKGIN